MADFLPDSGSHFINLAELLRAKSADCGSRIAFRFLPDGETEGSQITFEELELKARAVATSLAGQAVGGERALLYYSAGIDFITAFWGCLYAGLVAVPVFPARLHRHIPRLLSIAKDSEAKFVLTTAKNREQAQDLFKRAPELKKLEWVATDDAPSAPNDEWLGPEANLDTLALLQYTSGSTAAPRGVMVTHGNLLHNLACLREVFQFSAESVGVTWLPHYHDMGLIGGLLQPVYAGAEMILMPPSAFLQRPIRWLEAVTRYRATTMTAPNFAYDLCVQKIPQERRTGLDLSSVNVALCGAEPVRPDTLTQFAEAFGPYGFRKEAFRPAYGLAEATLIVSGRAGSGETLLRPLAAEELQQNRVSAADDGAANCRVLAGCGGVVPGIHVTIVNIETMSRCAPSEVGEIWICGPSVAQGYWRKPEETRQTFGAHLANGEGPFLRSGDLGFIDQGQVFVTGRLKDLIIVRGANHYPQDLEYTVERSHRALRHSSGAAFSIEDDGAERLIIVQEVNDRSSVPNEDAVAAIRRALSESHEVYPDGITLIEPRSIPRTSSGKIQRFATREAYVAGTLDVVHQWQDHEGRSNRKRGEASHPRSGLVWDYLSTQSYSHRLAGTANGNGKHTHRSMARQDVTSEPIAIIGLGCRFPGASDLEQFWSLLRSGIDPISEVPRERWDVDALYDPNPGVQGKMSTRWGGFLSGIDQFDTHFFGISPREAASMDPQQRLLLEVTWEALENGGQPPDKLAGTKTGVFVGIGGFDYTNVILNYKDHLQVINAYLGTGNAHSIAANRISYLLDLRGPSLAVDTACSSALVAVHMACDSLRSGQSNLALAGAVSIILSPEVSIAFSHARMMAADGRCKTFDAKADGYVRSEGCGTLVLKRLSDALHDRDNILGLIRGTAVNQDGRTAGIAAPNGSAQQDVMREALHEAGVSPEEVIYLEAHGTGTSIGDPIEIEAAKGVFGKRSPENLPCLIGSVKANIGHLENASGMAGIAKVLASFQHNEIPGQLHFTKLNPRISLADTRLAICDKPQSWPRAPRRLAGVSSFGFGGTNAHIVVEAPPAISRETNVPDRPSHILTLSARTDRALGNLATRFERHLAANPGIPLVDLCFSANSGRSQFSRRLAIVFNTETQLRQALSAYAAGNSENGAAPKIQVGQSTRKDGPRTLFLFGSECPDASAAFQFYEAYPEFRSSIDRCSEFLGSRLKQPLLAAICKESADVEIRDVAIFALECALAELWQSWGVIPEALSGLGVGEFAAAVIAGVMTREDALKLICERARLQQIAVRSPHKLDVVGGNGNRRAVGLDESSDFHAFAATIQFQAPRVAVLSSLSGQLLTDAEISDPSYWSRHASPCAQTDREAGTIESQGYDFVLEIGGAPEGVLKAAGDGDASHREPAPIRLRSIEPEGQAWQSMLTSLASIYVRGASIDWNAFDKPYQPLKVPLPNYPFERERCWQDSPAVSKSRLSQKPPHPLLGERLTSALPMPQFQKQIGPGNLRYLRDHRIQGSTVFPATAYLEMARAAGAEVFRTDDQVLSNVAFLEALILPTSGTRTIQVVTTPTSNGSASFQIFSSNPDSGRDNAVWTLHVSGDIHTDSSPVLRPLAPTSSWMDEIRNRCPLRKSGKELYQSLRSMGLEYGASFQGVDSVWCGPREALGEIRLPSAVNEAAQADARPDGYWIHPALLDSCLHVLAAAMPENTNGSGRKWIYLPSGLSSLKFFGRPGAHLYSHCVIRPGTALGAEFVEADIRVLDEDGRIVSELIGFRAKLVRGEAGQELGDGPSDLIYDIAWIPKGSAGSGQAKTSEPSSWLILAGKEGIGQALAAQLTLRGENCVVASPSNLKDAVIAGNCHNIIYFSNLDLPSLNGRMESIEEAETNLVETMQFVQAVLRQSSGATRRLWFVTRGAQSVGPQSSISMGQTPIWGLAKSIDLEHPELRCTRIDLDPEGGAEELTALLQELSHTGSGHEVAFRKGTRLVARLVPRPPKKTRGVVMEIPATESFRLEVSRPGNLENLILKGTPRVEPRRGEVEIQVRSAGLNFRDVMNAAGVYPGGPIPFGAECSGTISARGPDVTDLRVGDEVMAVASGSMGSFVMADARAVALKPSALSFEQAAAIPIAFLTAQYSLQQLAKLSKGERILIHGAAGGVGLAAVQLAQRAGAEIFATAGSPEKRAYLESIGVPHVLDSRSLMFADEITKRTGGHGVDVVLNSLPGEYITRSLSVLGAYGRFVEIGKTDIYQNKPMGLFPFRNNLSYFALDLDRVCRERPELVRSLLMELMTMFEKGELRPLPHHLFPIEDAANAFRYIARRKNIGKVVLSFPSSESTTARLDRTLTPRADATYMITGGNGALGLAVARWMVERGARHLVLLNRSGISSEGEKVAAELAEKGATIKTVRADVSNEKDLARALSGIEKAMPPLRGIIHAAGVLDDRLFISLDAESLRRVLAPKLRGSWNLHSLTSGLPLDFFIVFSSVASVLGSPGQANYAAANAFLDGLAHHRRALGLPGLSVNWGPWAEAGMAARASSARGSLSSRAMPPIPPARALATLDLLCEKDGPAQAVVMSVDWTQLARSFNGQQPPSLISELLRQKAQPSTKKSAAQSGPRLSAQELLGAPSESQHTILLAHIQKCVAQVMSLDAPELDPEESMSNLGLDSLMALELQHSLEENFGVKLPIELLLGKPSLNEFVARLLAILTASETSSEFEAAHGSAAVSDSLSRQEVAGGETAQADSLPPRLQA